jgi:hypothetical protein
MEGIAFGFLVITVLLIVFVARVWSFMARHPLIRLLHDVSFQVDLFTEDEAGNPTDPRTVHVRIRRTQ